MRLRAALTGPGMSRVYVSHRTRHKVAGRACQRGTPDCASHTASLHVLRLPTPLPQGSIVLNMRRTCLPSPDPNLLPALSVALAIPVFHGSPPPPAETGSRVRETSLPHPKLAEVAERRVHWASSLLPPPQVASNMLDNTFLQELCLQSATIDSDGMSAHLSSCLGLPFRVHLQCDGDS